jgi:DedD protein
MDTAVKERLVGGAILVVLVVLIVPAILTGPREPPPPEPDSEGPTKTVQIDLGRTQTASDTGQEPVPDQPAEQPVIPLAPTGLPDSTAAAPTPAATQPAAPAGDSPVATPPSAERPSVPAGTPVPAAAQPPPPARQEPASSGSAWAVQLAAFSNQDSARKMVADLKNRGYSAFVLEYRANDRVLYRVRVGPEGQRERAAALASRLQGEGFKATVVTHP